MARTRTDSKESAVKIMQAAAQPVHPPSNVPLDQTDLPFFANVISEFARSQWSDHALEIAAMMARCMNDLNREQQALRAEGYITTRANGTTVENPRQRIVKSLTGDLLSLRRSLGVNARAREEAHVSAKKTSIAKSIETESPLGNGLIARPQ
jgi:phage terminase small subunit